MKRLVFTLFVLTASATPSWGAGLTLSIRDGLVSLDAQDVTLRQILMEWARVGKTRIINVERITGGPITLKIDGIPEKQALDIILRAIPGYMALPRETLLADASLYDRILIMATTTAVAAPRQPQNLPGFPGMPTGFGGGQGATVTQLRPNMPSQLSPGVLPDQSTADEQMDDPAIAAAAAAGLIPMPAGNPGPTPLSPPFMGPLMPPGGAPARPGPNTPGAGAPTNPFNVPVGTAQPSLAPPPPTVQPPPAMRARPLQADR
jgi:hypothetical protein